MVIYAGPQPLPRNLHDTVHNVASSLLLMGTPAKVELAAQLRPNAKIGCRAEPRVLLVDLTMVVCLAALLVLATVR